MKVIRQSRCFFCALKQDLHPQVPRLRRRFHASPAVLVDDSKPQSDAERQQPVRKLDDIQTRHKPVAATPAPVPSTSNEYADRYYPAEEDTKITKDEIEQYTPQQQEAIRAAQSTLPDDYQQQTNLRSDPWRMRYVDHFTEINPILDKPVKKPWSNIDEDSQLKTDEEDDEELMGLMEKVAPQSEADAIKTLENFMDNYRVTTGSEKHEREPVSAMAPLIPTMVPEALQQEQTQPDQKKDNGSPSSAGQELNPSLVRLMKATGYTEAGLRDIRVKTIIQHFVTNQTRLGKIQKSYTLAVAGNGRGLVGIGEGKSESMAEALEQARYRAIRNMQPILRYENRTIFGDVKGFGIRCQAYIYEICKAAGIADMAARVTRARNPMNTVKAAMKALHSQRDPEEVAKGRGRKMVDVRKVYYAGNV
ncbi:hypothetical protein BT93_L5187 [Corymbia citriodora subsp. variegata]|uniref:Small ribosomal subunit protein uS5m n=1 Tax=Corymbia citriodora subsp. variegata TaxID=360336 RepID=A0A8T0CFB3_CORYI|nr:hypothetical protein BT93_L5187 [Corymbia citriodora subsp. variegata]